MLVYRSHFIIKTLSQDVNVDDEYFDNLHGIVLDTLVLLFLEPFYQ
jgi:hypothetical protein